MIRLQTDLDLYNLMMSRETNFRFTDMSSIFKNPRPWKYIRRLFTKGGAEAVERIKSERPILHILTHNVMTFCVLFAKAMGKRFRLIELVRHPLHMVKQWHLNMERFEIDARDFTLRFKYKEHELPFFVRGLEEKYMSWNKMDRVIYIIDHLTRLNKTAFRQLPEKQKSSVLIIPFENFVKNEKPYMVKIEELLGTMMTPLTHKELRKQNVPRKRIADGTYQAIYKEYGWEPAKKNSSEQDELRTRRDFVAQHASADGMKLLDRLCQEYVDEWGDL